MPGLADSRRFAAGSLILVAVVTGRFVLEYAFLLPSPVGDSAYFITASANYCVSSFLGTTAYPIDPTGQSRMVWHGFVSPMLFGKLNFTCQARNYYLLLWLIKATTSVAILVLARWRNLALLPALGLALFALAAQTTTAFRPESLAILWIVLAELAIHRGRYLMLGVVGGTLLCTQPTVAGIYGLAMLLLRPELTTRWKAIGLGAACAILLLISLYPFPILDLIAGIALQARRLIGRSDGRIVSYYLLLPALPSWSLLLLAALAATARRRPLALMLLPVLWFFGPRVPPVFYNLIPVCFLLTMTAIEWSTPKVASMMGIASLVIGVLGLGFVSLRDALTVYRYGDTFRSTSVQVAQLANNGSTIADAPFFLALTNPALRFTDPTLRPAASNPPSDAVLNLTAANGTPRSPCPVNGANVPAVFLGVGAFKLFNSNSGWMVYICRKGT